MIDVINSGLQPVVPLFPRLWLSNNSWKVAVKHAFHWSFHLCQSIHQVVHKSTQLLKALPVAFPYALLQIHGEILLPTLIGKLVAKIKAKGHQREKFFLLQAKWSLGALRSHNSLAFLFWMNSRGWGDKAKDQQIAKIGNVSKVSVICQT